MWGTSQPGLVKKRSLIWSGNKNQHSDVLVEGWFNGQKMGYELFLDAVRVKFEPTWTRQQAIADLRWQKRQNPDKNYTGWFNGEDLNSLPLPMKNDLQVPVEATQLSA